MEDIIITLDEDFSNYLADIRENESVRMANEQARIENERTRNEYFNSLDKKVYCKRYSKTYGTIYDRESTFDIPKEYTDFSMIDVYVNGFRLNPTEYKINNTNKTITLVKPIDVVGTTVEIVVTKAVGLSTEDYNELRSDIRGYSAYEVATQEGFEGSVTDWLRSLKGAGGYKRTTITHTTSNVAQRNFALPSNYSGNDSDDDVDVYVNGFRLNKNEYAIQQLGSSFYAVLNSIIDVAGTTVEVDIVQHGLNYDAVDEEFDIDSINPVQNRVITRKVQDLENNKVSKETGKSLISNTEITRLANVDNYDDTEVRQDISNLQNAMPTNEQKQSWINKSDFSGNYEDLENKPDLSGFINKNVNNLTNYYKKTETYNKTEIDNKVSSVYKYKGSVANREALPTENVTVGDVYDLQDTGMNVAWNGTAWDNLGSIVDLSGITGEISALQTENKSLKSQIPNGTAEGESITLEDSAGDISLVDVELEGKTEQETREDKNKLKLIGTSTGSLMVNTGETLIFNREETIGGDLTVRLVLNTPLNLKANTTYTWSCNVLSGTATKGEGNSVIYPALRDENDTNIKNSILITADTSGLTRTTGSTTFTVEEDVTITKISFLIGASATYNNLTINMQIEENSTATEWQPYGASPSPEYPSEIHKVSGNVEVRVSNINRFAPTPSTVTYEGVTITYNADGTITLNGTVAASYSTSNGITLPIKNFNAIYENTTIGVKEISGSVTVPSELSNQYKIRIAIYNSDYSRNMYISLPTSSFERYLTYSSSSGNNLMSIKQVRFPRSRRSI